MSATYRWHSHFLQHMQSGYAGQRWVLKTPSHLAYLETLLNQYPDASIVWTHRQPLDAARLQTVVSEACANLDEVDPQLILDESLKNLYDGVSIDDVNTAG